MKNTALLTSSVTGFDKRSGKVRDLYDLGEELLLVATDRISAFDVVMPNGIPDKGRVLTQISAFWFEKLDVINHHVISTTLKDLPGELANQTELDGRFMLCKKTEVIPVECVVRGYLAGSGWKEYQANRTVCGIGLPEGLQQCSELEEPIFTPATKAEQGEHDENVSFDVAANAVGTETMELVRDASLALYKQGREFARTKGILIADTKFEFGRLPSGEIILIDDVLTPDSSRFWPADLYKPGRDQPSFDKQFVRDYLEEVKFNKTPPGPVLPADIVENTRSKYIEAYTQLTGQAFPWE